MLSCMKNDRPLLSNDRKSQIMPQESSYQLFPPLPSIHSIRMHEPWAMSHEPLFCLTPLEQSFVIRLIGWGAMPSNKYSLSGKLCVLCSIFYMCENEKLHHSTNEFGCDRKSKFHRLMYLWFHWNRTVEGVSFIWPAVFLNMHCSLFNNHNKKPKKKKRGGNVIGQ